MEHLEDLGQIQPLWWLNVFIIKLLCNKLPEILMAYHNNPLSLFIQSAGCGRFDSLGWAWLEQLCWSWLASSHSCSLLELAGMGWALLDTVGLRVQVFNTSLSSYWSLCSLPESSLPHPGHVFPQWNVIATREQAEVYKASKSLGSELTHWHFGI